MPGVSITQEAGVRYLQFGAHWIQGAMRVNRPWSLELEYTRDMMFPLLLRPQTWPRSVLLIGLGAASLTKFLHRYRPGARLDVVEIDPLVVMAAWQFFGLPAESRRLRIAVDDGYRFVATARRRYDLILVDGFDAKVSAGDLDSPVFYRNCHARLTAQGILATNLVSRRGKPKASIDRIGRIFRGGLVAFPRNEANTIVLAKAGDSVRVTRKALFSAARTLKESSGLDLTGTITGLLNEYSEDDLVFRAR
ncbi:MAG TPA: fused MFS/spermidine synthase [Burkholderiales bacterium]|nr:fused MFS/spermidine synthase [Burkholderiales bacterium]